jgi:hypothetical protein
MGGQLRESEFVRRVVDAEKVGTFVAKATWD